MIGIIILVVLSIITMIALSIQIETEKDNWGDMKVKGYKFKPSLKSLLGLFWLVLIVFKCFTMIPANNVGIMYNPFDGGIQTNTLGEGFKGKSPLATIYTLSTTVEKLEFKNLAVQTLDSQWVDTTIQVQARIDKAKAFEYFKKYRDKDLEDISDLISNTIKNELESVTTKYNIIDILGEKRSDIVTQTLVLVKEELLKDGILVERIILVDTEASKEIEAAISKEAVAKKAVDTAKYEKEKQQLLGEAKIAEAEATAKVNKLLEQSLTKEVIAKQFIDKWDGKLSTYWGSDLNIFKAFGIE